MGKNKFIKLSSELKIDHEEFIKCLERTTGENKRLREPDKTKRFISLGKCKEQKVRYEMLMCIEDLQKMLDLVEFFVPSTDMLLLPVYFIEKSRVKELNILLDLSNIEGPPCVQVEDYSIVRIDNVRRLDYLGFIQARVFWNQNIPSLGKIAVNMSEYLEHTELKENAEISRKLSMLRAGCKAKVYNFDGGIACKGSAPSTIVKKSKALSDVAIRVYGGAELDAEVADDVNVRRGSEHELPRVYLKGGTFSYLGLCGVHAIIEGDCILTRPHMVDSKVEFKGNVRGVTWAARNSTLVFHRDALVGDITARNIELKLQ